MFYEIKGKGIPIVFIHPPLLTSANFRYQMEHLSKKYQVITFDIRGHGGSSPSMEPITFPLIAQDILALIDHLKINKIFLCGYSAGGNIALDFLQRYSERAFGGIVISALSEEKDFYLKLRLKAAKALSNPTTMNILSSMVSKSNSESKSSFDQIRKTSRQGTAQNIKQYYDYTLNGNFGKELRSIEAPVLLLYGAKNTTFHKHAYELHAHLANSELIFLESAKHQIPTKEPQKLHDAIHKFIQSYKRENPFMI
ncbi:alpha/beta hydrolase [Lysinibacillus yapensis]|uniref:Alpha/beta hydrolase n=1 Tax=Ureibacillus yapensis TaxID=2304605 RepID=A0A396S5I8_9BACL|nr:alpha/beta hydrolase [Lysinibacillus yapensis]RHW35042.1 alpha/beta hydrolase [Lysinibacillus yapensis]